VSFLTNASGHVTDSYDYDAFGNTTSRTGETENNYLYCGEQFDSTTGLYYLRARYMNPSTGTFISMDAYRGSVYDPVSLHKYLYANANPVMYSDPSGYMSAFEMATANAGKSILDKAQAQYNANVIKIALRVITLFTASFTLNIAYKTIISSIALNAGSSTYVFEQIITYALTGQITELIDSLEEVKFQGKFETSVYVYVLRDTQQNNIVRYVGITNDTVRRGFEHGLDPRKQTNGIPEDDQNRHQRKKIIRKMRR
jgi:RHS repeat-associated protein